MIDRVDDPLRMSKAFSNLIENEIKRYMGFCDGRWYVVDKYECKNDPDLPCVTEYAEISVHNNSGCTGFIFSAHFWHDNSFRSFSRKWI